MHRAPYYAVIIFVLGGVVMAFGPAIHSRSDSGPVRLDSGSISGELGSSPEIRVFKGIPFAAPPVGNLRWRPPQPVVPWDGVRVTDQYGPACMQNPPGGVFGQMVSEDCLYLNVWTAANSAGERRPVMVWIYGGGYNAGSGSQPEYDGEALAKKGAVVVTLNYRLGVFGFLSHPELTRESAGRGAANFGLLDSIAALQWVQKNIEAFGGDVRRVTIFGESAGAGIVANLMVSPLARGLFQRAIGESSSWTTVMIGRLSGLDAAEQAGARLAAAAGASSLAELRSKPAAQLLMAGRGTGPVIDGWSIPEDPGAAFADGDQNDVPVLVGSNRDESFGAQPPSAAQFIEESRRRFGDLSDTFLNLYPAGSDDQAKDSAFTAARDEMAWVVRNWARMQTRTGKSKAYVYYFTQQPPAAVATESRFVSAGQPARGTATHTAEIQYVFQNLRANRAWTDLDRRVADIVSSYWVNFAANGDPNGKGLPKWPAYDEDKNPCPMVLGDSIAVGPAPNPAQLMLFSAYYDKLYAR